MNELIPICKSKGGRDVVSARKLHQFLEVGTRFNDWFRRRVEEYSFTLNVDYSILSSDNEDVMITLDMAKELSMVERNVKGQQARRYFIECEKQLRQVSEQHAPFQLPTTYKDALRQLLEKEEQRERIEQQLALAQPKVDFFDAVSVASNCIAMSAAAAVLKLPGVGRNKLFRMLRRDGILKRNNEPFAAQINAGHFQVEPKTYDAGFDGEKGKRLSTITRVTPAGLNYLQKKYKPQQ